MIKDVLAEEEDTQTTNIFTTVTTLIVLSIATSIDSLAVGLSFGLLGIAIFFLSIIIGITAFMMTFVGVIFGKALNKLFGRETAIIDDVALIMIGCQILW